MFFFVPGLKSMSCFSIFLNHISDIYDVILSSFNLTENRLISKSAAGGAGVGVEDVEGIEANWLIETQETSGNYTFTL